MSSVAKRVFEKTVVGNTGSMHPDQASKQSDADFQSDVNEARRMASAGLIEILKEHRESESGHRYVDLIFFRRIK